MADYFVMAAHSAPDYELADTLNLGPEQLRTLYEPTRLAIIELLGDRAATTSELAEALGKPKGTVGHHCKALETAGLISVVRTAQVRAITAKYYGRTARTFILDAVEGAEFGAETMLAEVATEITRFRAAEPDTELPAISSVRYARIPDHRAKEWVSRLDDLITEFTGDRRRGERVYGMAVALFPTTKPTLGDPQP